MHDPWPPLNVLQLGKFYPPLAGGIETVMFELSEGLNRLGQRTDVLCADRGRHTVRELAAPGYSVTRAGSFGMALSTAISPALVLETRRIADRYDIVHVHMPDPMAAIALLCARPRAAVVVHWHSDIVNQRRALKLYEPLQSWLLRRADAIIATTAPYAESSPWLQPFTNKVRVVPIGISEPNPGADVAGMAAIRARFGGRRIVFSLGRMTYYKGFDFLIEAAASMPDDAVIVVGGSGGLLEHYRATARARGVDDRIVFIGRVESQDLPNLFAVAELFCLPSIVRSEAYGVVLLEAMLAARPIVATEIPGSGVQWVNQHGVTGLNVPVRDGAALGRAIRQLLDDAPLARRMGDAGRRRFDESLTADRMAAAVLDVYRALLPADARGSAWATAKTASPPHSI